MSNLALDEAALAAAFKERIEAGDGQRLGELLDELPAGQVARLVSLLDTDTRGRLFEALPAARAAALLARIPDSHAEGVLERLHVDDAVSTLAEMPSARQADLIAGLEDNTAELILNRMTPADAKLVRQLSEYDDDVAGGLMDTEYLAYHSDATVQSVVDDMARNVERYRNYIVQYSYVTNAAGQLVGVLRLRDLLLSRRDQRLSELMLTDPVKVADSATLDELREFFDQHRYFGVPVVDPGGLLIGLVRQARVEEALADRADHDYLKTAGIVGGEELRSMPVLLRSRRRLAWLSVNVLLNVAAASIIALFQDTLASVIALAVFLPIISDMSGCSGNQAVAVSMRELALGITRPGDIGRVLAKEVVVGLLNGMALGALIAAVAFVWKGNPWLGLVVGLALMANTVVAVAIGGTVPLILRRAGFDPALASGPVLTTITDMCGFLLVLGMATAILPRLTG